MTPTQVKQFNAMRATLLRISREYQTPTQIEATAEKRYGLPPNEALQYAYENIQREAADAVRGVRPAKGVGNV